MTKYPKFQTQTFTLYTYDLWGNARDGWDVNNKFKQGTITIKVKGTVYNQGTDQEFVSYHPTDLQINRAIGGKGIRWEGETEYTLYGESKSGKPIAELERVNSN